MTHGSPDLLAALRVLLDQALELSPGERTIWLAKLRQTQPDHAREIEYLLEAEASLDDRQFLFGGAVAPDGADDPRPTLSGRRIGAWTLERQLGQGGMGTVWLARRSDGRFEGIAAVKLPNFSLLDARGAERFRREGTALARLNHPHIARLLDAGVTDVGQPYLVLEYVDGERLDRWCDARTLSPEARLRLFLDVLDAVAHAHANLVVHRDLKPSNILVTADGTVKLLDFGIAKLLEEELSAGSTTLTDVGGRAMTPEYAAPEQVTGDPITTATDVYSLGVLLYTVLAGRHPTGEEGASPAVLLRGVVEGEPRRLVDAITSPEARGTTPERLRRLYAGDLDNIVAKALKKQPVERYLTVTALASDLQRYLTHQPVSARPDSLAYRLGKFVRRNRVPVSLGAIALLALVGGLIGTITQTLRASRAARVAADERDFALRQLSRVEVMNNFNYFMLSEAAPSGKPFTVATLMAQAESIVERDPDTGPNRVDLFVGIGEQYFLQEEPAKALRLFERAYVLSRKLRDPTARSVAACQLGRTLADAGEMERGERLVREGLGELTDEPRFLPDRVVCLSLASEVARSAGDMALSVSRIETAESLFRLEQYPAKVTDLNLQSYQGLMYQTAGRLTDASRAFERAHRLYVGLGRDRTKTAGTFYNNWALMLGIAGQPLAAESLFRRAIEIDRSDSSLATVSPRLLGNYARTLAELGRFDEAAGYAEQAYTHARRTGDDITANVALRIQATVYTALGDLERARSALAELAPRLQQHTPGQAARLHFLSARAQYSLAKRDLSAAFADADSAVRLAEVVPGANQFQAMMLLRRAEVERDMGRFGDVERDARLALDATRALVGDVPSAHSGNAHLLLGHALRAQGHPEEAVASYRRAVEQFSATLGPDHAQTQEAQRFAILAPGEYRAR